MHSPATDELNKEFTAIGRRVLAARGLDDLAKGSYTLRVWKHSNPNPPSFRAGWALLCLRGNWLVRSQRPANLELYQALQLMPSLQDAYKKVIVMEMCDEPSIIFLSPGLQREFVISIFAPTGRTMSHTFQSPN